MDQAGEWGAPTSSESMEMGDQAWILRTLQSKSQLKNMWSTLWKFSESCSKGQKYYIKSKSKKQKVWSAKQLHWQLSGGWSGFPPGDQPRNNPFPDIPGSFCPFGFIWIYCLLDLDNCLGFQISTLAQHRAQWGKSFSKSCKGWKIQKENNALMQRSVPSMTSSDVPLKM